MVIAGWKTVLVHVQDDHLGIYWSRFFGGTSDLVLPAGINFKYPWDKIFIYDSRPLDLTADTTVLLKDGIEIKVQWSGQFSVDPAKLSDLHREIGPDYIQRCILPSVDSSFRKILASYRKEDILADDKSFLIEQVNDIVSAYCLGKQILINDLYGNIP